MRGKIVIFTLLLLNIILPLSSSETKEFLVISNETGFTLADLYISDMDSDDWGKDLLQKNPLLNGETFIIPLIQLQNVYINVRGRDTEGDTYTVYSIDAESEDVVIALNNIDPD